VPNLGSSDVSVIDGTSVVATASVGLDPQYAAFDGGNGYVYVPNANSDTVSVIATSSPSNGGASSSSSGLPSWAYVIIGVAIAGVAVGVVMGVMRHRRQPRSPLLRPPPDSGP